MLKKFLILLIKYIPVIQMMGIFINNILFINNININNNITIIITNNSALTILLLIVCSYVFNFCIWHRLIIIFNFINNIIQHTSNIYNINYNDLFIVFVICVILSIIIFISIIYHNHEYKIKYYKKTITRSYR